MSEYIPRGRGRPLRADVYRRLDAHSGSAWEDRPLPRSRLAWLSGRSRMWTPWLPAPDLDHAVRAESRAMGTAASTRSSTREYRFNPIHLSHAIAPKRRAAEAGRNVQLTLRLSDAAYDGAAAKEAEPFRYRDSRRIRKRMLGFSPDP